MSSNLGNRLAGLPKIPKIKKKSAKTTTKANRSPPKPVSKLLPSGPPPAASNSSSSAKPISSAPPALPPIELSDDDSLSELESSSSSDSGSSDSGSDSDEDASSDSGSEETTNPPPRPQPLALPALSAAVLPPLPPLPPLPSSFPVASTSKVPVSAPTSTVNSPKPVQPPSATSSSSRPRPLKPSSSTTSTSHSTPTLASRPKSTLPTAPTDLAYSPSNAIPRPASTSSSAPQRMSLRQVLALSLQEAEDQQRNSASSTRENTPDATEILNLAKGKNNRKNRENGKKRDGGNESDSSLSTVTGDEDASSGQSVMEVDDEENGIGNMEKQEERFLREEIEKKKRTVQKGKGKQVDEFVDESENDLDATESDEDLVDAWDKNAKAMEQIRRKRNSNEGGDISFDRQSDEDSDVAVTDLPPGNGFGVVTWSDYDSFGSEEEDDDGLGTKESEEDQLAEVLLAEKEGLAGEFEEELEQLFALSEAVVGPIRHDEYEAGDLWFEALSDYEGSTADDETEDGEGDDIDAEMIFGEEGELKRIFGARKKQRLSTIDSSAGESNSDDEDGTESEDERDVELVRVGVHLDGEGGVRGEEDDEETESYHSEDEETDSSCSDTDIYRYAPRTGALANLQAPTTADLASLVIDEPTPSTSSSRPRPPFAPSRHSAPSTLEVPTFDHVKGKAKAKVPTFRRRAPKMGTFDTTERKNQANESDSGPKIVVVGSGDELAPSPFRVPFKKTRQRSIISPRRERSDSRVSTTSGTSESTSLGLGSNIGSPVLGNVVFPTFDLDSLLQDSAFEVSEPEEETVQATPTISIIDPGGATSSETDTGTNALAAAASNPPPDFSRWNRIPIGAFRSRTTMGGGNGRTAPSQVLTAQAAAVELRKNKNKRRNSLSGTNGEPSRKRSSLGRKGSRGASEDEVASSILRDHKAVKSSLRHTLGTSPATTNGNKRKAIRSRMLTSPVLAPTLPSSKPSSSSLAAVAAAVFNKNKKKKRSKSPGGGGGSKPNSTSSRIQSRQNSSAPPTNGSTTHHSVHSTPSTNLLPLHSPLFPKLEI